MNISLYANAVELYRRYLATFDAYTLRNLSDYELRQSRRDFLYDVSRGCYPVQFIEYLTDEISNRKPYKTIYGCYNLDDIRLYQQLINDIVTFCDGISKVVA